MHSLPRSPECVASIGRTIDYLQRGGGRRLDLVRDIRMPEIELGKRGGIGTTRSISEDNWVRDIIKIRSVWQTFYNRSGLLTVHFFQAGLPRDWSSCVLVERSPVATELELFLDANFLIAEDWNDMSDADQRACKIKTYKQLPFLRSKGH